MWTISQKNVGPPARDLHFPHFSTATRPQRPQGVYDSVSEVLELSSASRVAGSRRFGQNASVPKVLEPSAASRGSGACCTGENVAVLEVSEVSSAPGVAGADLAQRSFRRRGQVSATAGESERIIGLRESDLSSLETRCTQFANSW